MSRSFDILSIGHIDDAVLNYMGTVTRFLGGAVFFSSIAAARSKARAAIVTKLARRDSALLEPIKAEGIEVYELYCERTTRVENLFETADVDKRKVRLLSQADPFKPEDIPELDTAIYHLAGLFAGEFPDELFPALASRGPLLALDLQAMLRTSSAGGFEWMDWEAKREMLPLIHYLKADSQEAEVITGSSDREVAAKILQGWGAKEVMISHASEVIVFDGERLYRSPFTPRNLSGRTGRGDTVFAAYMVWRKAHGIQEALDYAATLTSIKMESPGPFKGSVEEVEVRLAARSASAE